MRVAMGTAKVLLMNTNLTPAAAAEVARYRRTMFRAATPCGNFSDGYIRDSIETGEQSGNEYVMRAITDEIPAHIIANAVRPLVYIGPARCDGGVQSFDTWYDCSGCMGCRGRATNFEPAWSISAFVFAMVHGAERARLADTVTAMQCLANIGKAIEAALSPGRGVAAFIARNVSEWHRVVKGRWYRIATKRGNAKEHNGKIGCAKWVGESTFGGYYDRRAGMVGGRTSTRVGLTLASEYHHEGLVYVSENALEPIVEPENARTERTAREAVTAVRATYKAFEGRKGDFVYIIDGAHKGKSGIVIWIGEQRGSKRVGVVPGVSTLPKGRSDNALWLDARDVAADVPAECGSELSIEIECVLAAVDVILSIALRFAGFDEYTRAGITFEKPAKRTRKPRAKASVSR